MKKNLVKVAFFLIVISFLACENENINEETQNIDFASKNVLSENGILVFDNYDHLDNVNNDLLLLSSQEIENWEKQFQFVSLKTIDKKINEAEVNHQESFFKGLNPNLTLNEYKSLGYDYQHTSIYIEYLNKGTIVEKINEVDGSISTSLSVKNQVYLNVLNEEGKVIVGSELLVFIESDINIYDRYTNKLIKTVDKNTTENLNGEFNFNKGTGSIYNRWVTDPSKGSNYRYYGQVNFSSSFTTSSLSQTFYWSARAEQKKYGNWNTRNNYNPIWGCSANWSYDYWIIYPGAGYGTVRNGSQYPLPNSSGLPTSPYNISYLNTNYTVRSLQFSSMYSIIPKYVGYSFFDNVRVYNYNFVFKFSGGSSGYNYTAY